MWSVTALHVTASLWCPVGCPSVSPGAAKPQLSLLELEMLDTPSQELEHPEAFLCLSFLSLHWLFLPSFLLGYEITGSRGWSTTKIELYFGTSAIRAESFSPGVEIQVWQRPPQTPAAVPGTHTGCPFAMVTICYVTAQHCPVPQPTTVLGVMAAGPGCSCPLSWALTISATDASLQQAGRGGDSCGG